MYNLQMAFRRYRTKRQFPNLRASALVFDFLGMLSMYLAEIGNVINEQLHSLLLFYPSATF